MNSLTLISLLLVVTFTCEIQGARLLNTANLTQTHEEPQADSSLGYSCPEYYVDFDGHNIEDIASVASWNDCGKYQVVVYTFQ